MRHLTALLITLITLAPVTASAWELTITRPERSGPVMLVCFNPNALIEHVSRLTRNQVIGIRAAAFDGEVRAPCDDVQLPVGTRDTGHARWLQTEDGWWILARTVRYPNDIQMVIADPGVAQYRVKPPEFRMRFVITGNAIYERVN